MIYFHLLMGLFTSSEPFWSIDKHPMDTSASPANLQGALYKVLLILCFPKCKKPISNNNIHFIDRVIQNSASQMHILLHIIWQREDSQIDFTTISKHSHNIIEIDIIEIIRRVVHLFWCNNNNDMIITLKSETHAILW